MRYTARFFYDSMPEWKRKKDPILTKIFYRPISFYISAIAANLNISANAISYFSAVVGIIGCLLFLSKIFLLNIFGAVLINVWLLLDCTDGNLARSVKSQPFGEFADAISSYILVGLMCNVFGIFVFFNGGIFLSEGNPWMILTGALASSSDTIMRLIYQKYKNAEREMADNGTIEISYDIRTDKENVDNIVIRIENELGIGGILPFAILAATIFGFMDLLLLYCFLYYGVSCIFIVLIYIKKARKVVKAYEKI